MLDVLDGIAVGEAVPLAKPDVIAHEATAPAVESDLRHFDKWSATTNRPQRRIEVLMSLPSEVRDLLDRPNYVHLATLRRDGSPRSWVVWAGVESERILVCTDTGAWKAKDMQRDPRVSLTVVDLDNPYRMAAVQGRVVEMRSDADNRHMDVLSHKYTGKPFPNRSPTRVCFVIEAGRAGHRTLGFEHSPGE